MKLGCRFVTFPALFPTSAFVDAKHLDSAGALTSRAVEDSSDARVGGPDTICEGVERASVFIRAGSGAEEESPRLPAGIAGNCRRLGHDARLHTKTFRRPIAEHLGGLQSMRLRSYRESAERTLIVLVQAPPP